MIKNKAQSLKFLLDRGADYRKLSEDDIPIVVYPLLKLGQMRFDCMEMILNYVKEKDGWKAVRELVNSCYPNLGDTALHMACLYHNNYGIKLLFKYVANLDLKDRDGKLAYDLLGLFDDTSAFRRIRSLFNSHRSR